MSFFVRKRLIGVAAVLLSAAAFVRRPTTTATASVVKPDETLAPDRSTQLKHLKRAEHDGKVFDLLVVGGGATGTGIALDAQTRGLSVCLVERDDYAAGTSSRSTKLIHGGVRYLEAAFKQLDYSQAHLVFEALQERALFLRIAPHLTQPLPIMTPTYSMVCVVVCCLRRLVCAHMNCCLRISSKQFTT